MRPWEFIFLIAFASGILITYYWQSGKQYLSNDELVTAVVVNNSSFSEMLKAIRHGGELNPPLFFILEWIVARTVGASDLALRAIPSISIALAGWVLFFTVRPLAGPRIAALAVSLVLGLSREVFNFLVFARYYGLLLLLVSLAAFLALRFLEGGRPRLRDCVLVFLVNCALVYLHLYGLVYSGMILAAMVAIDVLRRKARWGLYGAILGAWATFGAWIPSMRQQLKSVSGGVFTPPGFLDLGFFLDQLALQTPLALVFLVVAGLGCVAMMSTRPNRMAEEAITCSSPTGWLAWALVALTIMGVPFATWAASHVLHPPPYMIRYMFPCLAAWVFIIGLALLGAHRLPQSGANLRIALPAWLGCVPWCAVLVLCILFQPMRARKLPSRPAAPFVDEDFGYKDLPIVFENSWYYLQRAWYGRGREYVMLIDHDAAEADPGWFTKNMEREFKAFSPRYDKLVVLDFEHLPDWPNGFLAVDDDFTKTFEWVFAHRPELKVQLLGKRMSDPPLFGEQRIYLVRRR